MIVSAHDDPKSLVGALHNTALGVLERAGHKLAISDLYAMSFNPVASSIDFLTNSAGHANYMFEQQRAVNTATGFSPDIQAEMDKLKASDMIIFHFPLWWAGPPSIMKGWIERVMAMGFAWNSDARYSNGLMKGKTAFIVTTVGDPTSFYSAEGMHKATVEQHLYGLLHNTLAFCGFSVLSPFVIDNTTASSVYDLEDKVNEYAKILGEIDKYDNYVYKNN